MHHPRRQNVTTSMVRLKQKPSHEHKNLTKTNGEPHRHSWERRRRRRTECKQFVNFHLTRLFSPVNPLVFAPARPDSPHPPLSLSLSHMYTHSLIIIIIIIIIIAFQGAIRDFLQSPHSTANCLQHARSSGLGAIVCKSRANVVLRATWYEGTAQLLSLTELKSHVFELILLAESLNR